MKKTLSVFVIALAVFMVYSNVACALPWDKKDGGGEKAQSPSEMQNITAPNIKTPSIRIEMVSGELVSTHKNADDTVTMTIRREDGTEVKVVGDAWLSMVRTTPISELKSGERITAHCMIDNDKKETRAINIMAGATIPRKENSVKE